MTTHRRLTTRPRRRQMLHGPVSHERWLVSYADFITLLFAFFTTLYAISTVDAQKLSAVVDSMQVAFANGEIRDVSAGRSPGAGGVPARIALPARPDPVGPGGRGMPEAQATAVESRLAESLAGQIGEGTVSMEIDPRGLVISIREAGSFATGSAELSPVAEGVLLEIARTVTDVGNALRVEGHTDDVPISTERYRSNWELSTARATTVVAFLVNAGLAPERLSASGYGEFHPKVLNDTEAGRGRNRRVDIVVLNPATTALEEPGQHRR